MQSYRSPGIPRTPKSSNALIEVFKLIWDVENPITSDPYLSRLRFVNLFVEGSRVCSTGDSNDNHASDDFKYLRWSSSLVTAAFGQSFKLCLFVRMFLVFFGQILIRLDRQMMLSGYCWIHVATDSGVYVSTYFLDNHCVLRALKTSQSSSRRQTLIFQTKMT